MDISAFNIPTGLAARVAAAQQSYAAPPAAPKNRLTAVLPAADRYLPAADSIIDAEYVDLYSPIQHPTEQPDKWRNLIVEKEDKPAPQSAESGTDQRNQQLIARYGQNSSDFLLPGSFVNLLV